MLHGMISNNFLAKRDASLILKRFTVAGATFATLATCSLGVTTTALAQSGEKTLAGVRVLVRSSVLEQKYGAAGHILEGDQSESLLVPGPVADDLCGAAGTGSSATGASSYGGGGSSSYAPSYGSSSGYGSSARSSSRSSEFGGSSSSAQMAQMYARMNGGGGGGGSSSPGYGAAATTGSDKSNFKTWVYDRPDGSGAIDFLVTQGRVVQVHVHGYVANARTSRGIGLGSTMGAVHSQYGAPETTNTVGEIINDNYSKVHHCAFQYYKGKVVGIIVAAAD